MASEQPPAERSTTTAADASARPEAEADLTTIARAIYDTASDPYSGVPSGLGFSRELIHDTLAPLSGAVLKSIKWRLLDEEVDNTYTHILISAIYHQRGTDMISNLDFFWETVELDTASLPEWHGREMRDEQYLVEMIHALNKYARPGFTPVPEYRSADETTRAQALALMTVMQTLTANFMFEEGINMTVTDEGQMTFTFTDERIVDCILRYRSRVAEMLDFVLTRESCDVDMIEEFMNDGTALREGIL